MTRAPRTATARVVVAGLGSGDGKTTVAVSLIGALRARGLAVAPFKVGPDYLDPTYHARAAGRPSTNIDGWMMGREAVLRAFARGAAGAEIAIVEGVMGLFDGAGPESDEGSTAEIARWLDAPVLLAVDSSGAARTVAEVARGITLGRPDLRIAGVVANRVGSRRHLDLLRAASEVVGGPPVVGGLPRTPAAAFPERHLGLRTAGAGTDAALATWADLAGAWIDIDAVIEIARSASAIEVEAPPPAAMSVGTPRCRIGVARDEAFHFYYEENLDLLRAAGAEIVPFSPIADAALPDVDGIYLGGGYPEVHAAVLADNAAMREAIRLHAGRGRPVYAECGGLMYLVSEIRTAGGAAHPMCGVLPGACRVGDRLAALGYVEVETTAPSVLGPAGTRLRGHEFRYSDLEGVPETVERVYRAKRRRDGAARPEGYRSGPVLASYIHLHFASCPAAAEAFVKACLRARPFREPALHRSR